MALQHPCCRCWLSSLHVLCSISVGFYFIWLLMQYQKQMPCLIRSPSSQTMPVGSVILTCDIVLYISAAVLVWSLLSIVLILFLSTRMLLVALQIVISSAVCLISVAYGIFMTSSFLDTCAEFTAFAEMNNHYSADCLNAVRWTDRNFKSYSAVSYYWNSLIGIGFMGMMSPIIFLLAVSYTTSIWLCRPEDKTPHQSPHQSLTVNNSYEAGPVHCCNLNRGHCSHGNTDYLHPDPHRDNPGQAQAYHQDDQSTPLLIDFGEITDSTVPLTAMQFTTARQNVSFHGTMLQLDERGTPPPYQYN